MPDLLGQNVTVRNYDHTQTASTAEQTVWSIENSQQGVFIVGIIVSSLTQDTEINLKYDTDKAVSKIWSQDNSRSEFDPDTDIILIRVEGIRTPKSINLRSLTAEGASRTVAVRERSEWP